MIEERQQFASTKYDNTRSGYLTNLGIKVAWHANPT